MPAPCSSMNTLPGRELGHTAISNSTLGPPPPPPCSSMNMPGLELGRAISNSTLVRFETLQGSLEAIMRPALSGLLTPPPRVNTRNSIDPGGGGGGGGDASSRYGTISLTGGVGELGGGSLDSPPRATGGSMFETIQTEHCSQVKTI